LLDKLCVTQKPNIFGLHKLFEVGPFFDPFITVAKEKAFLLGQVSLEKRFSKGRDIKVAKIYLIKSCTLLMLVDVIHQLRVLCKLLFAFEEELNFLLGSFDVVEPVFGEFLTVFEPF
jgi:hypothetical protein